jgi:RHS repeat-associated protein
MIRALLILAALLGSFTSASASFTSSYSLAYAESAKSCRVADEGNKCPRIGNALDRRVARSEITNQKSEITTWFYHGERDPQGGKDLNSPAGALGIGDGSHLIWKELRHASRNYDPDIPPPPITQIWYLNGESIDSWQARQVRTPGQLGYNTLQWFLSDRMGTIQAVPDPSGDVLESYDYSAFGVRTATGTVPDFVPNEIGFTGREHDSETGLIYYRARYMDPVLGRFISEDPIGFAAGDFNVGRYVGNGPLNSTDPYGQTATKDLATLMIRVTPTLNKLEAAYVKGGSGGMLYTITIIAQTPAGRASLTELRTVVNYILPRVNSAEAFNFLKMIQTRLNQIP